MSNTAEKIQKLAGTLGNDKMQLLICAVDSVDEGARTCKVTPINSNYQAFDCTLMSDTDDGVLFIPSIGSTVKVLLSNQTSPTVIQFSGIEKTVLTAGDIQIILKDGKLSVTNGSKDLFKILQNILNHIMKLTVSTGTGPSSVPVNVADFSTDLTDLTQLMQ